MFKIWQKVEYHQFVFWISHSGIYFRNTTYWVQDLWDIRQQNLQHPSCSVDISLFCQSRRYVLYTNPIYWVHWALENAEIMGYQAAKSATSVLFSSRSLCTGSLEQRGRGDRLPPQILEKCINPTLQMFTGNYRVFFGFPCSDCGEIL